MDMSATILHHGHIRLLKRASELGTVVVALTSDEDILKTKGYEPEIEYRHRKEILEAIVYVDEVVSSPWLLDEEFLDKHRIDFLVHGSDNKNEIPESRLVLYERTEGVSSSAVRGRVLIGIGKQYSARG